MRIGVFLPTYWQDYGAAGVQTSIEETAKAAQALGYASLWANDHVILMGLNRYLEGNGFEPL